MLAEAPLETSVDASYALPPIGGAGFRSFTREGGYLAGPSDDERPVLKAVGSVRHGLAQELVSALNHLDPDQIPQFTLDLRQATSLEPLVVHALMAAWERRWRQWGCVRILVAPGEVQRYLDHLALERALDIIHPGETSEADGRADPKWLRRALPGTIAHYRHMLEAIRAEDFAALEVMAQQAHPICIASSPSQRETPSNECSDCPVRHEQGGCERAITRVRYAASFYDWHTAEELVLALVSRAEGVRGQLA